ncbi:hypothetical protein QNI16_37020 [Cytophagaceae bacterium YF14B1]|uniref:Uncharacterized protein n=1 Tax=Xanthocytophaga flava TaxID=3048013 RepID=A0AAE3R0L6_9BACT|nr:hypothetical protein [Xanthocytophaga flavus]MDJ1486144.1 hypothetical protein [Xanthocytophaga flavus]
MNKSIWSTLLFCCFVSCSSLYSDFPQMSDSLDDAWNKKVFRAEYIVPQNPYKINDTLSITVKEAWIERCWKYNKAGKIAYIPDYQLIIICDSKDIEQYPSNWTIGTTDGPNFRSCARDCIMANFEDIPNDHIELIVQKGRLANNKIPEIIGKFELRKKPQSEEN